MSALADQVRSIMRTFRDNPKKAYHELEDTSAKYVIAVARQSGVEAGQKAAQELEQLRREIITLELKHRRNRVKAAVASQEKREARKEYYSREAAKRGMATFTEAERSTPFQWLPLTGGGAGIYAVDGTLLQTVRTSWEARKIIRAARKGA
jgi:hypothetical protein